MLSELLLLAFQSLWFIFPAYIANGTPVIVGGRTPIDFNKKFIDREPVLGQGKTWRGLFAAILAALLIAGVQIFLQDTLDLSSYGLMSMSLRLGFLLGLGAVSGDITKSFFKRRLKIKRGGQWFLVDQLDFIVGALVFSMLLPDAAAYLKWEIVAFLFIFTPLIHRLSNIFAFKTRLKNVPW